MRNYELVCILDPQVSDGKFDATVEKYEGYLKSNGAEVAHVDRWGMRQLAYSSPSFKKRRQGYYVLYQFSAEPNLIAPLEEELRIDEEVLRHLVVLVEGEFLRVPELAPEGLIESGPPRNARERAERLERSDRGQSREGQRRRMDERDEEDDRTGDAAEDAEENTDS